MATIFYDHLIIREEIGRELRKYNLTVEEHTEIVRLAEETIHHHVLDVILTHLPKEKHHMFLEEFHRAPGNKSLMDFLKKEAADIEKLIESEAKKVKKEILAEVKRLEAK